MRNSKVKGFTLIELIVVIAIIGVLAAILVPSMLGYVRNARISQANSNAKTVNTACAAVLTQASIDGKSVTSGTTTFNLTSIIAKDTMTTVKFGTAELDLSDHLGTEFNGVAACVYQPDTYAVKYATWTAGKSSTDANATASYTAYAAYVAAPNASACTTGTTVTTPPNATQQLAIAKTSGKIVGFHPLTPNS